MLGKNVPNFYKYGTQNGENMCGTSTEMRTISTKMSDTSTKMRDTSTKGVDIW